MHDLEFATPCQSAISGVYYTNFKAGGGGVEGPYWRIEGGGASASTLKLVKGSKLEVADQQGV